VSPDKLLPFELAQTDPSASTNEYDPKSEGGQRRALAMAPRVVDAIDAFWLMMTARNQQEEAEEKDAIDEKSYTHMHVRIQKAMQPEFNFDTAVSLAGEEFAADLARGALLKSRRPSFAPLSWVAPTVEQRQNDRENRLMDYTAFFASVFEIVDSWTDEVVEDTYVQFLQLLLARISRPVVTDAPEGTVRTDVLIDDLGAISSQPSFERSPSAQEGDYAKLTPHWDPGYLGGAKMTIEKARKTKFYTFSKDGGRATKVGNGVITVIRSRESLTAGKVYKLNLAIEAQSAGVALGDVDVGISNIQATERRSRLAEDGYEGEFCVSTKRPLTVGTVERCRQTNLSIGSTISLVVDLRGGEDGRLRIVVDGINVCEWTVPIPNATGESAASKGAKKKVKGAEASKGGGGGGVGEYHVCAAFRNTGLSMAFI